jgi:ribulose-phosphate 3-epimerase
MDNKFVHNKSVGVDIIKKYPINASVEAHLMVDYPENWIDELVKIGIDRIIFPIEDSEGIDERITHIKNHGLEVGLAVNPETPVAKVESFVDKIDVVLLMSVHPGFGGQEFIPEVLDKVSELVNLQKRAHFLIEVDGGINQDNIKNLVKAGVNNLAIGEKLIYGDIKKNLEDIQKELQS